MSFGPISSTIKKFTGEDKGGEKTMSKETLAIKLFSQGKTPVDVVVELDMGPDEASRIFRDFWNLTNQYRLSSVYGEIENDIPSFLNLFRLASERGYTEKDISGLMQHSNQIPSLRKTVQSLEKDIQVLLQKKESASSEYRDLQNKLEECKNQVQQGNLEMDELNHKIKVQSAYLTVTGNSIDNMLNGKSYLKINDVVERKVTEILKSKGDLLVTSIVAAILAISTHHDKEILMDYFGYSYNNGNDFDDKNKLERSLYSLEIYIQSNHSPLIEITHLLHKTLIKIAQNRIFPPLPKL